MFIIGTFFSVYYWFVFLSYKLLNFSFFFLRFLQKMIVWIVFLLLVINVIQGRHQCVGVNNHNLLR